jgi:hypothetical protein
MNVPDRLSVRLKKYGGKEDILKPLTSDPLSWKYPPPAEKQSLPPPESLASPPSSPLSQLLSSHNTNAFITSKSSSVPTTSTSRDSRDSIRTELAGTLGALLSKQPFLFMFSLLISINLDQVCPGASNGRMCWKDFLNVGLKHFLRIRNWPDGVEAPGPSFNLKLLDKHALELLFLPFRTMSETPHRPIEITRWTPGKFSHF